MNEIFPSIFSKDRKWVLAYAIIVMVILTVPYFVGFSAQSNEWYFTGFVFGVEDGNSYIAKMLRGSEGDWLFRTPYTAKKQEGVFAFFSYLVLGKLAASPGKHEQLVVLFHLYRIAAGILAILAIYDFIALFVAKRRLRFLGLNLACFGGGLGYILILLGENWWLGNLPLELYSPESFGFLLLLGLPHLAIARALFLWGFIFYIRRDLQKGGIFAGLLWLLMGIFQPLTIVQAWAIVGGHFLYVLSLQAWRWRSKKEKDWKRVQEWFLRTAWSGIIPLPLVLYTFIAFRLDPVVSQWTAQNLILSPHPLHYLVAYGLVLPFAIRGTSILLMSGEPGKALLPTWVLLFPFLVYAPYNLQRRLAEGIWIVLLILFLVGIEKASKLTRRTGILLLLLALPSTFILYYGAYSSASKPAEPLFRPEGEVVAFESLAEYGEKDSIVLCSYRTGNALPAWAAVFVLVGHGPESAGIAELEPQVRRFYQEETDDLERISLLREFNVDFVFWGPEEQQLGGWDPGEATFLALFFEGSGYEIYRVTDIDQDG
jgi:hypothetical protein